MKTFSKAIYTERRKQLKLLVGSGKLLFLGNEESSMNFKDNWYPFRQDSSFLYFFGLDLPGLAAVIDIDEDREMLFGNDLTAEESVWHGATLQLADLADMVGVDKVSSIDGLPKYLKPKTDIHILPPYRPENAQKLAQWLEVSVLQIASLASEVFIKAVVKLRSVKSPEEIREINKAVTCSAAMHKRVLQEAKSGMKEYEIVGMITGEAIRSGGNLSFTPIVTIDGQILHNHNYSQTLTDGKMLLCDFGAETAMHYAGDITRTLPVGPAFSANQKEVYQIVRDAHQTAIESLRPGVRFKNIHLLACKKLAEGLSAIGLMKGNLDDAVENGAHALFFPCGLGHMMGLDVHDMEDLGEQYVGYTETLVKSTQFGLKSLRLGKELEEGYVLTIEPGIYFNPLLIDQWKAEKKHSAFIRYDQVANYRDFGGIRIEDDFVITNGGSELLGEPLEVEIDALEAIRRTALSANA
ncbi:aminopeptidase P family protein [Lunatibacter salilacus]|uniref:aminopeptidase P family protein n=1 Tax=Lunatibacter salilacus TaxID=2483804 RepID=UPI00131DC4C5|nr:aminopeptidase P family protein [Lunatibacter salilacus]